MKLVKPTELAVSARPYVVSSEASLAVGVTAFFSLAQRPTLVSEPLAWKQIASELGDAKTYDQGLPKTSSEVLVFGSAFAPPCTGARVVEMRLELGPIQKTIVASAEQPFVSMPLSYALAAGGGSDPINPRGCARPSLTYPQADRGPHGEPAGLGPMDLDTPDRQQRAGTYDATWLAREYPGYPRDIDWTLFNLAPRDQWLPLGALRGGEVYRLTGLHPQLSVIEGRLPQLCPRLIVQRQQAVEVALVLETVCLFPSAGLGALIYRGRHPIDDGDGRDVSALLVAHDGCERRPVSHYLRQLALRTDPTTAADLAFDESALVPPEPAAPAPLEPIDPGIVEMIAGICEKAGVPPLSEVPPLEPPVAIPKLDQSSLDRRGFDLSSVSAACHAAADQAHAHAQARQAQAQAALSALPEGATLSTPAEPTLSQVLARSQPDAEWQNWSALFEQAELQTVSAKVQAFTLALDAKMLARATAASPLGHALPARLAQQLGEDVARRVQAGESLAGCNLCGVRLVGLDLSGADLGRTGFEHAELIACNLAGANLTEAAFTGARLEHCSLAAATLTRTNLSQATLTHVSMAGAALRECVAHETVIESCDGSGLRAEDVLFNKLRCRGFKLTRAHLERCQWVEGQLCDVDWSGAHLARCSLLTLSAHNCCFTAAELSTTVLLGLTAEHLGLARARLRKVLFGGGCVLSGANFEELDAYECGFRGADLRGARFSGARLTQCDLGGTDLSSTRFTGTLMHQCILDGAKLEGADLRDANLLRSSARSTKFEGCQLTAADLTQLDCAWANPADADLTRVRSLPVRWAT